MTDAQGWYWWEKAQIRLAAVASTALERCWFRPLDWLTQGRVNHFDSRLWFKLACVAYLIEDLRRGDMPPHKRIQGEPEPESRVRR